jgi:superfamily I DNA and RNA helicase
MAHIFRSKGNEALMVYVLNGDDALLETRRISRRNMLFTAITRSRAWVRICGVAPGMDELIDEMKAVVDHNYHLDFKIPTEEELQKLNRLGHELPSAYETKIKKSIQSIKEVAELLRKGEVFIEQLPADVQLVLHALEGLNEP